jgi:hypothetical protein
VWNALQNDLSSGWGYDENWYKICSRTMEQHTGVVDYYAIAHASGNSASGLTDFKKRSRVERVAMRRRFPGKKVKPMALASLGSGS